MQHENLGSSREELLATKMAPPWLADGVAEAIDKRRQELAASAGRSPTMTMDEVLARKIQGDSLIVIGGSVFNVGSFLADHPGGQHALLHNLGHDATTAFLRAHGPSAHHTLVDLFYADIVEPASTRTPPPAKLEVREEVAAASAASFGRDGGTFRSKYLDNPSLSAVDLLPALGEQSQLPAGGSMLSSPPLTQLAPSPSFSLPLPPVPSLSLPLSPLGEQSQPAAGESTQPLVGLLLPLPSQAGNTQLVPLASDSPPNPHGARLGAHPSGAHPPGGAHPSGGSATSCPFMM